MCATSMAKILRCQARNLATLHKINYHHCEHFFHNVLLCMCVWWEISGAYEWMGQGYVCNTFLGTADAGALGATYDGNTGFQGGPGLSNVQLVQCQCDPLQTSQTITLADGSTGPHQSPVRHVSRCLWPLCAGCGFDLFHDHCNRHWRGVLLPGSVRHPGVRDRLLVVRWICLIFPSERSW